MHDSVVKLQGQKVEGYATVKERNPVSQQNRRYPFLHDWGRSFADPGSQRSGPMTPQGLVESPPSFIT